MLTVIAAQHAHAADSSWLAPISGSFGDSRRWSNGAPGVGAIVEFGVGRSQRPFVVTLDEARFLQAAKVTNQRLTLDLAGIVGAPGFALYALQLSVAGTNAPSITVTNGVIRLDATTIGDDSLEGSVTFHDATVQSATVNLRRGTLTLDHASLGPASPLPPKIDVGMEGNATLTLTNGSSTTAVATVGVHGVGTLALLDGAVATFPNLVVGAGGNGTLTIGAGATLNNSGDQLALGGDFSDQPGFGPGTATATIDGTLLVGACRVGHEGTATLVLRDGGVVTGDVLLGTDGGAGTLTVTGNVTLNGELYGGLGGTTQPLGGSALIEVSGARTCFSVDGIVSIAGPAAGLLIVDDGATLAITGPLTTYPSPGSSSVASIRNSAHIWSSRATANKGGVIEVLGAGSRLDTSEGPSAKVEVTTDSTLRCTDGARVATGHLITWPTATCVIGVDADPTPVVSSTQDATMDGTLHVTLGKRVPAAGSFRTLIAAPAITGAFDSIVIPSANGFPLLYRQGASEVTVEFVDHIDAFDMLAPTSLVNGFLASVSASVTQGDEHFDLTPSVTWSSSDEAVLHIEAPGTIRAVAPGDAVLSATIGVLRATRRIVVTTEPFDQPFVLVSGNAETAPNGMSGISFTSGVFPTNRCVSADGSQIAFASDATNLDATPGTTGRRVFVATLDATPPSGFGASAFEQVSVTPRGASASSDAATPCISADGHFVAFSTWSLLTSQPVPPNFPNAYVRDRIGGTTELVSVTLAGIGANGAYPTALSDDGRYVLFWSADSNLIAGDTNGASDAFLRDRWLGVTTRVSVGAGGEQLPEPSTSTALSADGSRAVILRGAAPAETLVDAKDMTSGALIDVSGNAGPVGSLGDSGSGIAINAAISADGRFVALLAQGTALDPLAPPNRTQVFVRDLVTGELIAASRPSPGVWADASCGGLAMSGNGRYVSFISRATTLVPGAALNGSRQAYRFDRISGALELASVDASGVAHGETAEWTSLSGDGRTLAFATSDDTIAPFDQHVGMDVVVRRYGSFVVGDINADGATNALDLAAVIGAWGSTDASADLDGDGVVGPRDLAIVLGGWTE